MMDADSFLDNLLHGDNLGEYSIFLIENRQRVIKNFLNSFLLRFGSQIELLHNRPRVRLNVFLAEAENNDGVQLSFHDDFDDLEKI